MSDTTLNQFISRGTNAQRVAFTPSPATPATGNNPSYIFYETDTTNTYMWDGSAWQKINTAAAASTGPSPIGILWDSPDVEEPVVPIRNNATTSDVWSGSPNRVVEPNTLTGSAAPQTLTDGATINWNMALGYNAAVTLGGNRTLATPTNPITGLTYTLAVIQDATGSRTMTWPAAFDWGTTGAPTLTTTASKVDQITLFCTSASSPTFRAYLSGKGFAS